MQNCNSSSPTNDYNRSNFFYRSYFTKRTNYIFKEITFIKGSHQSCAFPHNLKYNCNCSPKRIYICNGEWYSFTCFINTDDDKLTRFYLFCNFGSANIKSNNRTLCHFLFLNDLEHITIPHYLQ